VFVCEVEFLDWLGWRGGGWEDVLMRVGSC
jgi:hypothetical protein